MNIYDFAGNYWEWTLEHSTDNMQGECSNRGGGYDFDGSYVPASYHDDNNFSYGNDCISFRATFY